jgi:hypothetical protein
VADEIKDNKVRVVDRRWLTAEGELRQGSSPPAPSSADPSNSAESMHSSSRPAVEPAAAVAATVPSAGADPTTAPTSAAEPGEPSPKVGFLDLVDFLAQQAVALLSGQLPGRSRDPGMARFFIDLLGVVQERTSGQLAPEETRYLEDVLYQLRSLFVAAIR